MELLCILPGSVACKARDPGKYIWGLRTGVSVFESPQGMRGSVWENMAGFRRIHAEEKPWCPAGASQQRRRCDCDDPERQDNRKDNAG